MKKCTKKEIERVFTKYLKKLNIVGYEIVILIKGDKEWENPSGSTYDVTVSYPYKRIILNVGKDAKTDTNDLLHEAFHVVLWRYTHLAENRYTTEKELASEEEHIIDHLTNTLYPLLK